MFHPTFKRALLFLVLKSFLAFVLTLFNFQGTLAPFSGAHLMYHTQHYMSRTFFKFFELYFVFDLCLTRQLCYITTYSTICQTLFTSFFDFFLPSVKCTTHPTSRDTSSGNFYHHTYLNRALFRPKRYYLSIKTAVFHHLYANNLSKYFLKIISAIAFFHR